MYGMCKNIRILEKRLNLNNYIDGIKSERKLANLFANC